MNYFRIVLTGRYRETSVQTRGLVSAARADGFCFDRFYLNVDAVIRKKKITKVLLECRQDFTAGVFSGLEEIRDRIEALKAAGKEVYFYAPAYGVQELFIASACTYRLIHPMGRVKFPGFAQSFIFAKRAARRIGIGAEVFRRGEYKTAGDKYRTDALDDANRSQYESFQSSVMSGIRAAVTAGFEKTEDDIEMLMQGGGLNAETAADAGWIDEIVTCSSFVERWKQQKDKECRFRKNLRKTGRRGLFREERVAVLVFEGAVIDGRSRRDPLIGQAIGSVSFIPQIRKLREENKVKAVVLRINSGGGSAFASEDITSELRLLAEKKPLIVSMSEVAGSGGYWMSCCGRKTFAMKSTLTGSIGVISIYLSWFRLLESLGITHDTVKLGEHADAGMPLRELTEKERAAVEAEIDDLYASFLKTAADHRQKTEAEIDTVGRGRVWSGQAALEHGLIDEIGGLNAAIGCAVSEAGLKRPVVRFYPEVRHSLMERLIMNIGRDDEESLDSAAIFSGVGSLLSGGMLARGPLAIMEEVMFRWK